MSFPEMVAIELGRARAKHPRPMNSLHEGYAVMLEEAEEFWDEVRQQNHIRRGPILLAELVQVAAMAQRTAEDLGLIGG